MNESISNKKQETVKLSSKCINISLQNTIHSIMNDEKTIELEGDAAHQHRVGRN